MLNAHSTSSHLLAKAIICLPCALATVPAGAARAADLCADMNTLVRQAGSDFSNWTAGTDAAAIPLTLPGAETCAMATSLTGQRVYYCAWKFEYRADGAQATFDAFNRSLQDCFGNRAQISRDQPVNHPDFYDLRQYQLDQIEVTVSIKDKSAMQSTYVFVRVHGGSLD